MTRGVKHSPFDANFHFLGERFEESTFSADIATSPDLWDSNQGLLRAFLDFWLRKNAQKMPLTRVSGIF